MNTMFRLLFILLSITVSFSSFGQVSKVELQASGLTCSMCSNAINKALKTLSFVNDVKPDIKNSSFEISIKPNSVVDFDDIKKKVEAAGFHVAKLSATVHFNNEKIENDKHLKTDGLLFHFLHVNDQVLNGDKTVQILDKGFVSAKEYKKNESLTKMECYKTGITSNCCNASGMKSGTRIYHVTM